MKKKLFSIFLILCILVCGCSNNDTNVISKEVIIGESIPVEIESTSDEEQVMHVPAIDAYFEQYDEAGCIFINVKTNEKWIYNDNICSLRMSPLSTFKILNTLILLEEGAFEDKNSQIIWDGSVYPVNEWNCDQTLESAFKKSVVWVYQESANKVNREVYENYIENCNYGNKDVSGIEGTFWINSSLEISLIEQCSFLLKLYNEDLDFEPENIKEVKQMMLEQQTDQYSLYGKTGSDASEGIYLYVGYVEGIDGNSYVFAAYISDHDYYEENQAKMQIKLIADEIYAK